MSKRELFEQRFPVPAGIYWNEISEQYDALPGAAGFDDVEIYHGRWEAWQAARAVSGQGVEPVALLQREIGESTWFDHVPVKPNTREAEGLKASPILDYCEVYTHPKPAQQGNQEDLIALLTNALANIRDTDASAKTLQNMAALALRVTNELATTHQPAQQGSVLEVFALCEKCHKEFSVPLSRGGNTSQNLLCNFCNCPHCNSRNDLWIKLTAPSTAATPQPQGDGWIPEGWKLVPIEPTPDMRRAFHEAHELFEDGEEVDGSPDDEWRAMLDAAPQPPVEHCNAQLQENSK